MQELVIGTRGSVLALWQARYIQKRLQDELGISSRLQIVKTKGDKITDVPLAKIGGKGLFTKELEEMLLENKIDLAVHSLKDVPVVLPNGLELVCITEREDVRDCFLSNSYENIMALPKGAKVGTTSMRRCMQLKTIRSDLKISDLRGNIQTRLQKLQDGVFDAIILACAASNRLCIDISQVRYIAPIPVEVMIPAMGQGDPFTFLRHPGGICADPRKKPVVIQVGCFSHQSVSFSGSDTRTAGCPPAAY